MTAAKNNKGVVSIFLTIGILISVVITIFLGTKIFAVLIKQDPATVATETKFDGLVTLAAPENVIFVAKAGLITQKYSIIGVVTGGGPRKTIASLAKANFGAGKSYGLLSEQPGTLEAIYGALSYSTLPVIGAIWFASDAWTAQNCLAQENIGVCGPKKVSGYKVKSTVIDFNRDGGVRAEGTPSFSTATVFMRIYCNECWPNQDPDKYYAVKAEGS